MNIKRNVKENLTNALNYATDYQKYLERFLEDDPLNSSGSLCEFNIKPYATTEEPIICRHTNIIKLKKTLSYLIFLFIQNNLEIIKDKTIEVKAIKNKSVNTSFLKIKLSVKVTIKNIIILTISFLNSLIKFFFILISIPPL